MRDDTVEFMDDVVPAELPGMCMQKPRGVRESAGRISAPAFETGAVAAEQDEENIADDKDVAIEKNGGAQMPSLRDICLVVVGRGPEAEELVRRRREACGRCILLWTGEAPSHQHLADPPGRHAFRWRPPRRGGSTAHVQIRRLRHELGSYERTWCKFGPDVVELTEGMGYEVWVSTKHDVHRIRAFDAASGSTLWDVSGAVVFVGAEFKARKGAVRNMEEVRAFDVVVQEEEMKPFATVSFPPVLLAAAWYGVQLFFTSYLMIMSEGALDAGGVPWWRGMGAVGGSLFGNSVPAVFGFALIGVWPSRGVTLVFITTFFLPIFVGWSMASVRSTEGFGYTCSFFAVCVASTVTLLAVGLPIFVLSSVRQMKKQKADLRGTSCKLHFAWMLWMVLASLGAWILMYGVALCYLFLSAHSKLAASCALPIVATLCEHALVKCNGFMYMQLVCRPRNARSGRATMNGDQRRVLDVGIQLAHAYKESTMLISLLGGEAATPDYTWIIALLQSFVINVIVRGRITTLLRGAFCPMWTRRFLTPTCFSELHTQVRFTSGYPRFVPVVGVAMARLLAFRGSKPMLFNQSCIALVCAALLFEALEDVLVWNVRWPSWGHYYDFERLDMFDIRHLFAFDCEGIHFEHVALGFHGMRSHDAWQTAAIMAPASYFSFTLITLLLGAGYVHGVCPDPFPSGVRQLVDGLIWQSPLRCI
mmetsp:Transcript_134614/g.429922  ORF Transcript_134614/g.429922 Transcript_134614/m.429922 type:complete len:705 (+) Transcript_134614:215-2329(+)